MSRDISKLSPPPLMGEGEGEGGGGQNFLSPSPLSPPVTPRHEGDNYGEAFFHGTRRLYLAYLSAHFWEKSQKCFLVVMETADAGEWRSTFQNSNF